MAQSLRQAYDYWQDQPECSMVSRNRFPQNSRREAAGSASVLAFRSCNRIIGSTFPPAERSPDHGRALSLETQSSVIRCADAAGREKQEDHPLSLLNQPAHEPWETRQREPRIASEPTRTTPTSVRLENRLAVGRDADNDHFRPRASHAERALICQHKIQNWRTETFTPRIHRDPSELLTGQSEIRLTRQDTTASFYVTTFKGDRHRHYVTGVDRLSSYLECQLWLVNSHNVFHWTHEMLTHWLRELEALDQETVLTLVATTYKNNRRVDTYLEVVFIPIHLDGRGVGSQGKKSVCDCRKKNSNSSGGGGSNSSGGGGGNSSGGGGGNSSGDGGCSNMKHGYEILIRAIQKQTVIIKVTNVSFQRPAQQIRIRHGAQYGHFLRAESNCQSLSMTYDASGCEHVFTCYKFVGDDDTLDRVVFLCVLQVYGKSQFIVPSPTSSRLTTLKSSALDTSIDSLKEADPRFFAMVTSGQGEETYFLRPLMFQNYFIYYDAVDGLKLKLCDPPPYDERFLENVSNFTFEFLPAPPSDLQR
ncbi:hypothetical protein C0Q70_21684 [Pomacea canaliculata]|uniref:Uncharacterized protein n=1 Tax=Pomacea canaliculata TaxID=400727 RepID=A0A2T7NDA6_POMCA|nr:hypothetical protein C0Q70_21684 [Pomacea canaliculata]